MKQFKYLIFLLIFITSFTFFQAGKAGGADNNGQLKKEKTKVIPFSELKFTDIGAATKPGKVTVKKDKVEVVAGGADIWGKNDEFYFGYTKLEGDSM